MFPIKNTTPEKDSKEILTYRYIAFCGFLLLPLSYYPIRNILPNGYDPMFLRLILSGLSSLVIITTYIKRLQKFAGPLIFFCYYIITLWAVYITSTNNFVSIHFIGLLIVITAISMGFNSINDLHIYSIISVLFIVAACFIIMDSYEIAIYYSSMAIIMSIVTNITAYAKNKINIALIKQTEELNKQKKIIEEQNKIVLETAKLKEQFLANMSHEIRTPLNAIKGVINLFSLTKLNEQQKDYIKIIKYSSNHLLTVINDILDLSKIEADQMDFDSIEFDLRELLNALVDTFQFSAKEKNNKLSYHIDTKIPTQLIGDPNRLNQILFNLVGNAMKFTNDGKIDIHVSLVEESSNKVKIQFSIKDTGIGIPQDKLKTIFENFAQVRSDASIKHGGTGLGLTISKKIIELQNSTLTVKSEEGKGSEFSFVLDFLKASKDSQTIILKKETLADTTIKKLHILLVEDNHFNRLVAKEALRNWEVDVELATAQNGKECIEQLKTESQFDIILMDILMPVMDGYEATKYIREEMEYPLSNIPIVAVTAHVLKSEINKCLALGIDDVVSKPINEEELFSKIIKAINKKSKAK